MAVALVTGAGGGLGREIAKRLAERDFEVRVTDLDPEAAAAVAGEIEAAGGSASSSGLDVGSDEACREAARAANSELGSLEVWVNNAGVLITGPVWEQTEEQRELLFRVNTRGLINGSLAALELMRPAGRGHVINVVSLAGLGSPPGEAMYAATKHAAIGFGAGANADLRRAGYKDIHISSLCPDGIWTPMISGRLDDEEAAPSFSGKLLNAEDVAAAAVDLIDNPSVVRAIPRWRGAQVKAFSLFPNIALRGMGLFLADARRKQKRWKKRIESGREP